jgi:bla regulator protein blaR1
MIMHKADFTAKALLATAMAATLVFSIRAQSQAGAQDPLTFDVASVKPVPDRFGLIHQLPGNQTYEIKGAWLRLIMTVAYQVTDRQINGGPSWMTSDFFDIMAKAAQPRNSDDLHTMLRHLLEERFNLKVRREARQETVWALTVDKGGSKMPVHDPEDKVHEPIGGQALRGSDGTLCPGISGQNVTMNYFAFFLSRGLDRGVIDKTGLPGAYDVKMQYMPEGMRLGGREGGGGGPEISPDCADIFAALPKQLGLRLESAKGPVEYLVVEHAEKPTGN